MTPPNAKPPVVILYKGHSEFDSLNTMVDHWSTALRTRGLGTEIVDLRLPDAVARTVTLIRRERVVLFLSLNGYGVPRPGQGPGFYQETQAPLFVYFVDHPVYHHQTLRSEVPQLIASFPTPSNLRFCRGHIRENLPLLHLPHAAQPGPSMAWEQRNIQILLAGTLHEDPAQARSRWTEHGTAARDRLESMVTLHLAAPRRALHEIVLEVLNDPIAPIETVQTYFWAVDTYLRSRVRLDFLSAAKGLPMTLVGRGWDAVIPEGAAVRSLGEKPISQVFELMARSKIVLNLLPPYYESHERPFQAMAHGAVAASVVAPWLSAATGSDSLLALPPDPAAAASYVGTALAQDDALAALAATGSAALRLGHDWSHRLTRLLGWIKSVTPALRD